MNILYKHLQMVDLAFTIKWREEEEYSVRYNNIIVYTNIKHKNDLSNSHATKYGTKAPDFYRALINLLLINYYLFT